MRRLEDMIIAVLADLGVEAGREPRLTGVWVAGEKVAAVGAKVSRGRTMHGFALNVDPDLSMFSHIVPCGIRDRGVTSLRCLLGCPLAMKEAVEAVTARLAEAFGYREVERQDVVWHERPSDLSAFSRQVAPPTQVQIPGQGREQNAGTPARLLGRLAEAGVAGGTEERRPRG